MLTSTHASTTTDHVINGQHQRVKKQTGSSAILYVYDESGQLLGEYDETGATIQEYIWHGTTLVGIMKGAATAPAL